MLNEEQIESFQRNGFLNGGCVLDDAAIAELSEDLERIVQQGKRGFTEGSGSLFPSGISMPCGPAMGGNQCGRLSTSGRRPTRFIA